MASIQEKKGNRITEIICNAAKNPDGKWVEYFWPKAGENEASRKITFAIQRNGEIESVLYATVDLTTFNTKYLDPVRVGQSGDQRDCTAQQ